MRLVRFLFLFSLAAAAIAAARAQAVHWENGDSSLGSNVQLVFEDCEPDGDPQLPAIPNASLTLAGSSTSINMVNMSVSRTLTLTYAVQSRRGGPLQIPAFTVKTNKGPIKVAAFNGAAPSIAADSVATSKLVVSRTTMWAGEVFDLAYRLTAVRRNNPQFNGSFDWNPAPLVTEEWGKPAVSEAMVDGQRSIILNVATRAYTKVPGTLKLDAAHQVITVQTGIVGFNIFAQPRMEPVSITSDQPVLEVRPLPQAPAGFDGAVGQFRFTSKIVPKDAAVGEPVTWTLELSGTGNWPDITTLPSREVSKDFQVVQPKAKRTPVEGKLFEATMSEDVVLVPTKPGTYTLAPVTFTFFSPKTGSYETARAEGATIKISAPANNVFPGAAAAPSAPAATTASTAETESTPHAPATAPAAPAGIPRDPLPGSGDAPLPISLRTLIAWLVAPVAALILFWFALAWNRAVKTDPLRPRREAHARLGRVLEEISDIVSGGTRVTQGDGRSEALGARLLQWQHDTAVLWKVSRAAPDAANFETIAGVEWAVLWREADRTLYGANVPLPADWVDRAATALRLKRIPGFKPYQLFLPRNLLAFAAAVAVLVGIGTFAPFAIAAVTGPTAEASYRAGDFRAAETAWRAAVEQHPTDWIARHNLSLALAQQDRNGDAAAQAIAAFVQHPDHPSVRWHLAFTTDKAGFAPAPLLLFLHEGPGAAVAVLASPAEWQRILIATVILLCAGLGWMLFNAYHRRSRIQFWTAGVIAALLALAGLASVFGITSYGEAADIRAAIAPQAGVLRSIPTEADTAQKTTTLPPGSIGIVNKTFLGWNRLEFSNGQTGWVRKDDVVPLWR